MQTLVVGRGAASIYINKLISPKNGTKDQSFNYPGLGVETHRFAANMIKCLLANNDSVVDKLLSESVLELEYLEKNVLTDGDSWLESPLLGELKVWHVAVLASGFGIALLSAICCLLKVRIPRTKSDIEANHKRKALLKQFNGKMRNLNSEELDDMNYR